MIHSWCVNGNFSKQLDHVFIKKEDKKRMINCETGDPAGVMSNLIDSTMIEVVYIPQKKYKETSTKSKIKSNLIQQKEVLTKRKKKKKIEWLQIQIYKKRFQEFLSKNIIDSNPNSRKRYKQ